MRWINFALALLALAVALTPPHRTRQWRHRVADFSVWAWIRSAKVFRIMHDEFWSEGNGSSYRHEMGTGDFYKGGK